MSNVKFIIGSNDDDELRLTLQDKQREINKIKNELLQSFQTLKNDIKKLNTNIDKSYVLKRFYEVLLLQYIKPNPITLSGDYVADYSVINNNLNSIYSTIETIANKVDEILTVLIEVGIMKEEIQG